MSKYYNINKMITNKPVLTQLKEILIGKELFKVRYGSLCYAKIVDLDNNKVIAIEERIDRNYVCYIPYNSKEWLLWN